jgi:hypothetical protein
VSTEPADPTEVEPTSPASGTSTAHSNSAAHTPVAEAARERLAAVRTEVAKAVVGQEGAVSGLLVALLCRGPESPRRSSSARWPPPCRWRPGESSSLPT